MFNDFKDKQSDAATFTCCKRSLDKAQADLKALVDEWQHPSDDWDDASDGSWDVSKQCGVLSADMESAVLISVLLSQLRMTGIS